jgi:FkbM family methyltransferase
MIKKLEKLTRKSVFVYYWLRLIYFWYSFIFKIPHEAEFKVLRFIPDRSGEIIDVGANDGLSAISVRVFNQTNPIISFEPNKFHEGKLKWLSNRLENFSYEMIGVGKKTCETKLYTPVYKGYALTACAALLADDAKDLEGRGMFVGNFDEQHLELEPQKVKIIRLDDLKLNPILVKIDIEGGELAALQGMQETLKLSRPVLIVESHQKKSAEINNFLNDLNYDLIDIETMQLHQGQNLISSINNVFWPQGLAMKNYKLPN